MRCCDTSEAIRQNLKTRDIMNIKTTALPISFVLIINLIFLPAFSPNVMAFSKKKSTAIVEVYNHSPSKDLEKIRHKITEAMIRTKKIQLVSTERVSGYFNTYVDSIFSLAHCMDNYIPGILDYADMPDVAGLIAPRGLFAESGTKDPVFPIAATRKAYRYARRIHRLFGAEKQIGLECFEDEHRWWRIGHRWGRTELREDGSNDRHRYRSWPCHSRAGGQSR